MVVRGVGEIVIGRDTGGSEAEGGRTLPRRLGLLWCCREGLADVQLSLMKSAVVATSRRSYAAKGAAE